MLDVLLQWLMDYNAKNWQKLTYRTWTIGRVALATPHGARACVLWTKATSIFQPIQWSRVLKEVEVVDADVEVQEAGGVATITYPYM